MHAREHVKICTGRCNAANHVFVGQPVTLEAIFAEPCFSRTSEAPTQATENCAETPGISFRLLDANALHTVPSQATDRYWFSLWMPR